MHGLLFLREVDQGSHDSMYVSIQSGLLRAEWPHMTCKMPLGFPLRVAPINKPLSESSKACQ